MALSVLVGVSRFTKEIPASRAVGDHQPNCPSIINHDFIVCFVIHDFIIHVKMGDALYFAIKRKNSKSPVTKAVWDPAITYED
jgi:hypothetical protein